MPTDTECLQHALNLLEGSPVGRENRRVCAETARSVLRAHGRLDGA
ncbi:MAG: hypothetical protein OXU85_01020 [Thaumarchaeota archaeon]|nr:hypothetical protein [Nitrososphaerota archaeon]